MGVYWGVALPLAVLVFMRGNFAGSVFLLGLVAYGLYICLPASLLIWVVLKIDRRHQPGLSVMHFTAIGIALPFLWGAFVAYLTK